MNTHPRITLAAQSGTHRISRRWTDLTPSILITAELFTDVALIVAMSCLTGLGYHLIIYGDGGDVLSFFNVGVLASGIFVIPGVLRGYYKLANLFTFKLQARRSFHLWNATFICLLALGFVAKITIVYSRGWMILFYVSTIPLLLLMRYLLVQATVSANAAGLVSARRVFLIGEEQQTAAFLNRFEPWSFGITVVGRHFLTPLAKVVSPEIRSGILDTDLQVAVRSARMLEPDAVFLVLPWLDSDTIDRCSIRRTSPVS